MLRFVKLSESFVEKKSGIQEIQIQIQVITTMGLWHITCAEGHKFPQSHCFDISDNISRWC